MSVRPGPGTAERSLSWRKINGDELEGVINGALMASEPPEGGGISDIWQQPCSRQGFWGRGPPKEEGALSLLAPLLAARGLLGVKGQQQQ